MGRYARQNDNGVIRGDVRSYDIIVRFVEQHCINNMYDGVLCLGPFAVEGKAW